MAGLLLTGAWLDAAEPGPQAEYLLKSAFLYNIAKFVEWNDTDSGASAASMNICMTGHLFGSSIDSIDGKTVQGRTVSIKYAGNFQEARGCQILFLETQDAKRTDEWLEAVAGRPILTVCDRPDCAQEGIMVNLQKRDDKIGIELNLDAVQRAHLKLSSQLIKLARLVGPKS